jgi:serpin B
MHFRRSVKNWFILVTLALFFIAFLYCVSRFYTKDTSNIDLTTLHQLADGNTAFGTDLYTQFSKNPGNIFFSPYSISEAFAMLYAGARGETAEELARVLHFTLENDDLQQAYRAQLSYFDAMARASKDEKITINIVNGFWTQKGTPLRKEYISLLRKQHRSKPISLNFDKNTDKAQRTIDTWFNHKTDGLIKNMLPQGALNADTQLVLANTIYFDARWSHKFNGYYTKKDEFHRMDSTTVSVPMMYIPRMLELRYAEGVDWQALELPYTHRPDMGEMVMLIILPQPGYFPVVESQFNEELLEQIDTTLDDRSVRVVLPKFTFTSPSLDMKEIMTCLGMRTVFDRYSADLAGISTKGSDPLFLDNVFHKASITVAEDGTVASAGTALQLRPAGVPIKFTADRPFIYLIRDTKTGMVLFMGRVVDPS